MSKKSYILAYAIVLCTIKSACADDISPYLSLSYPQRENIDGIIADIRPEIAPNDTYFAVMAWYGGYFGIQMLEEGKRQVIFSQWQPKIEGHVTALYAKEGSSVTIFHEGKEDDNFLAYGISYRNKSDNWKLGHWYNFVIRAWQDKSSSAMGLWMRDESSGEWSHEATFILPGRLVPFTGLYSFLEDWLHHGELRRESFRAPIVHRVSGGWENTQEATVSVADGSGRLKNSYNVDVDGDRIILGIGSGIVNSDNAGKTLSVSGANAKDNKSENAVIMETSITKDRTSAHDFSVSWKLQSKIPQLSYYMALYDNSSCSGDVIKDEQVFDSESEYTRLSVDDEKYKSLHVKLRIHDIFDNVSSKCFPFPKS